MTEKEKQVVEEAARKHADGYWGENYQTECKTYNAAGFIAGAEFALAELRKPSEELVEQIEDIITDAFITDEEEESLLISYPEYHFKADELNSVCLKIAELMQPFSRRQENDAGFEKLVIKEEPVEYRKDGLR